MRTMASGKVLSSPTSRQTRRVFSVFSALSVVILSSTASRALVLIAAVLASVSTASAQTTRIASDFEIQQMERQAAAAHDFGSQISAHMNLGDLRRTRGETSLSENEYRIAAGTAATERAMSRKSGNLSRYATATAYAGLAASRLSDLPQAFALLEEAVRYAADDPRIWNVYSAAMREVGQQQKAVSTARNAVMIQTAVAAKNPSIDEKLDLVMYQTSLAMALQDAGTSAEALSLMEKAVASLRNADFEALRKDAARRESFEINSTVIGTTPAYVALLNRSQLQLAGMYEKSGKIAEAKRVYRDVLKSRNDDPTALRALAKLSTSDAERAAAYADAFDANPFSVELIDDYQAWLETHPVAPNDAAGSGAAVRRALEQMARNENRAARSTLDALSAKFPSNDVVQYLGAINDVALGDGARARLRRIEDEDLRAEISDLLEGAATTPPPFLGGTATTVTPTAEELHALLMLLDQQRLTPGQRIALDRITFTAGTVLDESAVQRSGQSVFESGTIGDVRIRFSSPTAFAGSFPAKTPLRMSFRILGATESEGSDALLVEPLKLEVIR